MVKSIAVFGVSRKYGSVIAEKLAAHSFRLLLVTEENDNCSSLLLRFPEADIQILNCPAQSGWEADIIVLDVPAEDQLELIDSIRGFVTQKIVLNITELNTDDALSYSADIKSLLPYSKVINLSFIESKEGQLMFSISGRHRDALDETEALLKQVGFAHAPVDLLATN
ncbi:hypothetical protein [Daejeonella sp. H1SJ63]|jgi:hypothetical protein|uniref:hypothetical protein n=1 Tax=Daejeonella sp. H1SJ63 TaxID=3034145 RepID=UPI0023EC0ACD|nr:hypothetical protein [Daejeonella sp. H1SJ63]